MSKLLKEDGYALLKEDGDALLLEIHYARADFSGTGTLSAIGSFVRFGKATLTGIGTLTVHYTVRSFRKIASFIGRDVKDFTGRNIQDSDTMRKIK